MHLRIVELVTMYRQNSAKERLIRNVGLHSACVLVHELPLTHAPGCSGSKRSDVFLLAISGSSSPSVFSQ